MEQRGRGRPRGGGSRLQRTQIVTIRLDPKLRYLAELAARVQRRTLSAFTEWALDQALEMVWLDEGTPRAIQVSEASLYLWDPYESDRFIMLALKNPELLTYEEGLLWKLICECPSLWYGSFQDQGRWKIETIWENMHFQRLREHWWNLTKVASGEEDRNILAPLFETESSQQPAEPVSPKASKHLRALRTADAPRGDETTTS